MIKINVRLHLLFIAVLGSFFGYYIINAFIIPISFAKFLLIEIVITVLHSMYNYSKKKHN